MKLAHLIIACCGGIFIYLLGFGIFGPQGLLALQEREAYVKELRSHVEMLEALQASLANSAAALESNPELLTREANRLRYLSPNQRLVRILDGQSMHRSSSPGVALERQVYIAPDQSLFYVAGLGAFLLILIICNVFPQQKSEGGNISGRRLAIPESEPVPKQHP